MEMKPLENKQDTLRKGRLVQYETGTGIGQQAIEHNCKQKTYVETRDKR